MTCTVVFSIIAAITTIQLSSTVFLGLSSSSAFLSKTADVASSSDAITDTITARSTLVRSTSSYTKIIPSAVAQEEGNAEGESGDESTSEPEGGGSEEDIPVEGGDIGAEQVGPTTTTTITELKCDDGIDDDADGLIDLQDTQDCPFQAPLPSTSTSTNASSTEDRSMQAAEEQMPPTSGFASPQAQTGEFCGDNIDNNGNGQIDEGCPNLGAEIPTPAPQTPSPTPCPPGQDREPDTKECAPIPGVFTPSPVPGLTPTPQQQPILPPLTPSQQAENELGTAGPARGNNTSSNITDESRCIGCILEARPNTEAAIAKGNNTTTPDMKKNMTLNNVTAITAKPTTAEEICLPEDNSKTITPTSGFKDDYVSNEARIIPAQVPAYRPPLSPTICPPGISPDTLVLRGFPNGVSTGQPPSGKGILVVEKIVIIDRQAYGLPAKIPQDFRIDVRGPNGIINVNPPFQGAGSISVNPGIYSVFETIASGYLPIGYQGDCREVNIRAGDTKYCAIWNRPLPSIFYFLGGTSGDRGNMIIEKYIITDSGTAPRPLSDFNLRLTIDGRQVPLPVPRPQSIGPYVRVYSYVLFGIPTGNYMITENSLTDYLPPTFIPPSGSSGTLTRGDLKGLAIINNDRYR